MKKIWVIPFILATACFSVPSEGTGATNTDGWGSGSSSAPGGTESDGTDSGPWATDTDTGATGSQGGGHTGTDTGSDATGSGSSGGGTDTDGTDTGSEGGWGERYYDEEDCAASFGGARGYDLCATDGFSWPEPACHFSTYDKRSCNTICEAGGGECVQASDDLVEHCNPYKASATPEGCSLTDVERVCSCVYDPVSP